MKKKWLADFIIRTVWPYLGGGPGGSASSTQVTIAPPATASPATPPRITQQERFSMPAINEETYVGRFDVPELLGLNAALLYRSRGGEVLRSFVLSKVSADNNLWQVELLYSAGGIRTNLVPFDPPIVIELDDDTDQDEVFPHRVLPENSGIYAIVRVGPDYNADGNTRVDGILEIERNATLS